jgi:hypothetical protein
MNFIKNNQNNEQLTFNGQVNKIFYCGFSMSVLIGSETKVFYIHKFPPALGTTKAPNLKESSSADEILADQISKDDFINFWKSKENYQCNGAWKGGSWSLANIPTTDPKWATGVFIGDEVNLTVIKYGIPIFNSNNIHENSQDNSWYCNVHIQDKFYPCHVTNNIMPQMAIDVLLIHEFINQDGESKKRIKFLKRKNTDTIDMPGKIIPGGGEHLEPEEGEHLVPGENIMKTATILRTMEEEIGVEINDNDIWYNIPIGTFNTPGRDPRYDLFAIPNSSTGEIVKCSMPRDSLAYGRIMYYKSENRNIDKPPLDTDEIQSSLWIDFIEDITSVFPENMWMLLDHINLYHTAFYEVNKFNNLTKVEQDNFIVKDIKQVLNAVKLLKNT